MKYLLRSHLNIALKPRVVVYVIQMSKLATTRQSRRSRAIFRSMNYPAVGNLRMLRYDAVSPHRLSWNPQVGTVLYSTVYRRPGLWCNVWTDTLTTSISFNLRVCPRRDNPVVPATALLEPFDATRENPFPDLRVFARSNSFPLVSWVT